MDSYSNQPIEETEKYINSIGLILIICLIIFSLFNSLIIGLSWDEYFHHINGLVRFEYLKSLGDFEKYNFYNNQYYPGLYDTIAYSIGYIISIFDQSFYKNYFVEITHFINFLFSVLSVVGFYLIIKIFFNKSIAILASLLTLLNPFFFGHMGMNPKDIIIFFSLIWFCYFFYKYLNYEKNIYLNLILASFFIGFGCGIRVSFLAIVFPVFLCGLVYFIKKSKDKYLNLIKRFIFHFILSFSVIILLTILCWPHIHENSLLLLSSAIKNSIVWNAGPTLGLIDGSFYETHNTPSTYFLNILKFRIPFFLSILIFFSYSLIVTNNNISKKFIRNFDNKFIIINIIIFFPIIISILLHVKIYDNLRLFIFVLPFLSLLASFSLYHFLKNFKNSFKSKLCILLISFFFSIFIYRFIFLTPYQYSYVNFSYFKIKDSINKFEHDYWGTSFKELVEKIKTIYPQSEINKFKIAVCGGDKKALLLHLNKNLKIKKIYTSDQATHIIMTNRASFNINDKVTCFKKHKGEDLVSVSRSKLVFSVLRKMIKEN